MLRRLLVDSSVYTIASAVPAIAGFGMLPFYTRYLRAEDYGIIDIVTLTYTVITVVATLEVSQGLARFLPTTKDRDMRRRLSSTSFWLTTITMLAAVAITLTAAPAIASALLQKTSATGLLRLGGATALLGAIYGVALRQLLWGLRPRPYLTVTIFTTIVTAAATLVCLSHYQFGPAALLLGQAIGSASGLLLAWRFASDELAWTWDVTAAKTMLSFSIPLVASTLGVLAAGQASRWIVAHVGSLEAAGLYGIGARVASILGFAASGLQLSLAPLIYSTYSEAKTANDLALAFRLFVAAGLVLWSGLTLFAADLLRVLVPSEFQPAAPLIAPLGAAVLITSAMMFAPGLEIKHRTSAVAAVSLCTGALNLTLGWVGVAHFGAIGAAVAVCLSVSLQALLIFSLSQRCYPVPHQWSALATAVAVAVLVAQLARSASGVLGRIAAVAIVASACWFLLLQSRSAHNRTAA